MIVPSLFRKARVSIFGINSVYLVLPSFTGFSIDDWPGKVSVFVFIGVSLVLPSFLGFFVRVWMLS